MNTIFMTKYILEVLKKDRDKYTVYGEAINNISNFQFIEKTDAESQLRLNKSIHFFMDIRKLISERLNNMGPNKVAVLLSNDDELSSFLDEIMEEFSKENKV